MCDRKGTSLWNFFWETHNPRLMMRENIKQTQVEAYSMKHTS